MTKVTDDAAARAIDPINAAVGSRIKRRREEWFVSQNALSLWTKAPIGKIERGEVEITVRQIAVIAKALRCKRCDLLPEEGEQEV